jgi:hypothetical protein
MKSGAAEIKHSSGLIGFRLPGLATTSSPASGYTHTQRSPLPTSDKELFNIKSSSSVVVSGALIAGGVSYVCKER